jgi:hypothetical protein
MYPQIRQLDTIRREARETQRVQRPRRWTLPHLVLVRRRPAAAPCTTC